MIKKIAVADGAVKVRLPRGVRNGAKLRLPDRLVFRIRVLYWRAALHLLVAAVVVAGLLGNAGVFALLVGALWALLWYCLAYIRTANGTRVNVWHGARTPRPTGFRYYARYFGVLYLVPIATAVSFHVLLLIALTMYDGALTINQINDLQKWLAGVSKYFADNLKLTEVRVLGVLVLVYVLSVFLTARPGKVRVGAARGLSRLADLYGKYSGPMAAGLAVLAAFSLLGTHAGIASDDLQLRLKRKDEVYEKVAHSLEQRLSEEIGRQLYQKIADAMPADYKDALNPPDQVGAAVVVVRVRVDQAHAFGVRDAEVERIVKEESARKQGVDALPAKHTVTNEEKRAAPGDLTTQQVDDAARRAGSGAASGIEIVTEGQKKIVLQVEKLVTERLVNLVKPILETVPVVEPMLQSFIESVDKALQDKAEKAYNRIVDAVVRNSAANVDDLVAAEAKAVVADTDVSKQVADASPRASGLAAQQRDKAASLGAGADRLARQMDAKVSSLIADLGGADPQAAIDRLRALDGSLSQVHIQRLVDTMNTGGRVIRYNAALVVGSLKRSLVTPELKAQARGICGC